MTDNNNNKFILYVKFLIGILLVFLIVVSIFIGRDSIKLTERNPRNNDYYDSDDYYNDYDYNNNYEDDYYNGNISSRYDNSYYRDEIKATNQTILSESNKVVLLEEYSAGDYLIKMNDGGKYFIKRSTSNKYDDLDTYDYLIDLKIKNIVILLKDRDYIVYILTDTNYLYSISLNECGENINYCRPIYKSYFYNDVNFDVYSSESKNFYYIYDKINNRIIDIKEY